MNFQKLADDLGFELEEFKELVELFVETSTADLDKASSAVEAGDPETAARAIHSIKGASGNLGFMDLYEEAKKLEADARASRLETVAAPLKKLKKEIQGIAAVLNSSS